MPSPVIYNRRVELWNGKIEQHPVVRFPDGFEVRFERQLSPREALRLAGYRRQNEAARKQLVDVKG